MTNKNCHRRIARRPGDGLDRSGDEGRRAADPYGEHLPARRRQRLSLRPIYARADNPTFDQAEATLAALEGGAKALIFSSGMSAATAVLPRAGAGRPCRGAQGDVLVAAQLARELRDPLGPQGRLRRCRPDRRHRRRGPAGRHQAGLDRDAGQSDLDRHRHRRGGRDRPSRRARCWRSIRRWRRRC